MHKPGCPSTDLITAEFCPTCNPALVKFNPPIRRGRQRRKPTEMQQKTIRTYRENIRRGIA